MKILALIVLVCVISLAVGQTREQRLPEQDQPQPRQPTQQQGEDVLSGKRLLIQGKMGRTVEELKQNFQGLITNLNVGDLVLSHVAARLTPKGEKPLSREDMKEESQEGEQPEEESAGVLLNAWIFSDKKSNRAKTFFLVRRNPQDLGTCFRVDSDSSRIKDWVRSNEKCGQNKRGILYTLDLSGGEQASFPIDMKYTLCLENDKIKNITGLGLQREQVISAVQAHVIEHLDDPEVTDATTFLDEFSLPFHCAVAARKFDVNSIMESLKDLDTGKSEDREIIGNREEMRGSRETRLPLREDKVRVDIKPEIHRERESSSVNVKPIEKEKLNKPVEY
jgi:hypothetical protein